MHVCVYIFHENEGNHFALRPTVLFSYCYLYQLNLRRDKILAGRGIGGIENPYSVKCLHTHYAHHLARPQDGNLIGQWVDELLKELVPE